MDKIQYKMVYRNIIITYLCTLWLNLHVVCSGQFSESIVFPATYLQRQRPFELLNSNAVTTESVVEFSRAAEAFSLEYFQRLTRIEAANNKNAIVSTLSIWSLLLLLAEGSAGRTYEQLANVLRLPADLTKIRMVYKYLHSAFTENNTAVELDVNQVLFCDINRPIDVAFEEKLEHTYDADYYPVNFIETIETVDTINRYVKEKTKGKIDQILNAGDLKHAYMVLVSAIYFQGRWKDPFKVEDTRVQSFFDENDVKIADVPMMFRKGGCSHIFVPALQADIIELAYGSDSRFSMVVFLPKKRVPLMKVIDNLRDFGLHNVIDNLDQSEEDSELEIYLPRFSVSSDFKLNGILHEMGLSDLFHYQLANLSKISQHAIYVSQFLQKAVINVNEEGTIASAASASSISFQSIPSEFYVNRPFAFMIIERTTNSILFCGHVKDPSKF